MAVMPVQRTGPSMRRLPAMPETLPCVVCCLCCAWALAALLPTVCAATRPLLLISIDGLRPADVRDARQRGLKLPNLQAFLHDGSHAHDVRGVMPTLTYPSHTTLLTGVTPAVHGIESNLTFDPLNTNQYGWDWYASDIRVPTLWDAARAAGMSTANVHWPVSVGAPVDWNLPQIWRTGSPDDRKLLAALATPGLLPSLEGGLGPYADGIDESLDGDRNRARFMVRLLQTRRPQFMTAYFASLDHRGACQRPRHAGGEPGARRHRRAGRRAGGGRAQGASRRRGGHRLRPRLCAGAARREPLRTVHPGRPGQHQGWRGERLAGGRRGTAAAAPRSCCMTPTMRP